MTIATTGLAYLEDNMPYLFIGVLQRAMADYKLALRRKLEGKVHKLERFFYSDYCVAMLGCIGFNEDLFYAKIDKIKQKYT